MGKDEENLQHNKGKPPDHYPLSLSLSLARKTCRARAFAPLSGRGGSGGEGSST